MVVNLQLRLGQNTDDKKPKYLLCPWLLLKETRDQFSSGLLSGMTEDEMKICLLLRYGYQLTDSHTGRHINKLIKDSCTK